MAFDLNTIKAGVEQIGKSFEEFKSTNDENLKKRDGLLEEKLKKIGDDFSKKHEELTKAFNDLQVANKRPNFADDKDAAAFQKEFAQAQFLGKCLQGSRGKSGLNELNEEQYTEYKKAFNMWMHVEHAAQLPLDVQKSMSVGSDPDGGYWITPPEIDAMIRTRIFETSPVRQVATVQPISTHEYKVNQDPNELTAGWVSETGTRNVTATPQVATKVITAHEIYAQPSITRTLLEDAAVNMEQWLTGKVSDKIARVQNTAFLFGDGNGKPRGMCTYPAGSNSDGSNKWGEIEQIASGVANTFGYPSLIQLITALKDDYQTNASFLVRRQSLSELMTIKDTGGRYIFQPILNGQFNNTPLFGYTLRYAADMQATGASGNIIMAFGDFGRGYMIVDRVGTTVLRDELTQKPFVLFYTRQRVGGDVVDYDAIKLYKTT